MYLLDTNVVSELRPGHPRPAAAVVAWSKTVQVMDLYLSAISILEIERGVLQLEWRAPQDAVRLRAWFEALWEQFAGHVVPFSGAAARRCATMHVPDPAPERDAMIAATALDHGFVLVTRNVRDFSSGGVRLLNPWDFSSKG